MARGCTAEQGVMECRAGEVCRCDEQYGQRELPGGNDRGTQYGNLWMKPLSAPLGLNTGWSILRIHHGGNRPSLWRPRRDRRSHPPRHHSSSLGHPHTRYCALDGRFSTLLSIPSSIPNFSPAFTATETLSLWLFAKAVPLLHFVAPEYLQQRLSGPFIRQPLAWRQVAFQ